jgi:hypothetical protein
MQDALEEIAKELMRPWESNEKLQILVKKASAIFPTRMEDHLPVGVLDGGGPMTQTAYAECTRIKTLLGALARRLRVPCGMDDTNQQAHVANTLCDWIEGTLRPVYGESWGGVNAGTVFESIAESTVSHPKGVKEPSKREWAAYRLVRIGGKTQADAQLLMTERGMTFSQGQISKGLGKCDAWIKRGGIMPQELDVSSRVCRQPSAMDPKQIEMGERRDHQSRHQRRKF